jgi:hypothetical protein
VERRYYLASYPRSGNTLTRLLLRKHFGLSVPTIYPKDRSKIPVAPDVVAGDLPPISMWKTHEMVPEEEVLGAILIVRDARDAEVSCAHFKRDVEGKKNNKFLHHAKRLCRSTRWSDLNAHWLAQKNVAMVRYEDLVDYKAAIGILGEALEKIGIEAKVQTEEQIESFAELSARNPTFFRRGIVGSWKDELPPSVQKVFWETHGAMMLRLGYGG